MTVHRLELLLNPVPGALLDLGDPWLIRLTGALDRSSLQMRQGLRGEPETFEQRLGRNVGSFLQMGDGRGDGVGQPGQPGGLVQQPATMGTHRLQLVVLAVDD